MPSEFQFQGVKVALTYSMCPMPREWLAAHLKTLGFVETLIIGQEVHQEGEELQAEAQGDEVLGSDSWGALHLHAYCKWAHKVKKGGHPFDITWNGETYHPHVVKPKYVPGWTAYCLKEDLTPLQEFKLNESSPQDYKKRKGDFEEWSRDQHKKNKVSFDPPTLSMPGFFINHSLIGKQRHIILIGPVSCRKSTTLKGGFTEDGDEVKGIIPPEHYYEVASDVHHPYDNYNGERFIIYDDHAYVTRDHLITVCDQHIKEHPAPGKQRWGSRFIPAKQRNIVILIFNPEEWIKTRSIFDDALLARFKIYRYDSLIV